MDRINAPEIIDLLLIAGILLIAALGSWRGAVKEVFISVSLLLSILVAQFWASAWAEYLVDWFDFTEDNAELIVRIAIPLVAATFIGYVASVNAGIPPADGPGRMGGLAVGAMNAVVLFAVIGRAVYTYFLAADEQETVRETHVARALIFDLDRITLALAAISLVLAFASVSIRRRRMAILVPTGAARPGSSGYQMRRERPLAPEAEKIETGTGAGQPDPLGETMPIARVADPSGAYDRSVVSSSSWRVPSPEDEQAAQADVIRCVSCGERLSADDRFCPRCGRSLVR